MTGGQAIRKVGMPRQCEIFYVVIQLQNSRTFQQTLLCPAGALVFPSYSLTASLSASRLS